MLGSPVQRFVFFLCASRLLVSSTSAEERPPQPAKPLTTEQAADQVMEAANGKADRALQVQAHVRAQEKWKYPYCWAAWMLWGLPE